jgi:hypothetical protein
VSPFGLTKAAADIDAFSPLVLKPSSLPRYRTSSECGHELRASSLSS